MAEPNRSPRRIARFAALAALGAWAIYLVGMNVFVGTRLFRNTISAAPDTILVDYAYAYSIVPGRIHAEGLSIRGRDSNVEWVLRIDDCTFRFFPLDLARRRFHVSHVHGDGLSLRIRRRRPSFSADETAALPPVPGFSTPPYSGPRSPPLTDADYHLWSIWLEGVVADHVREIWIDTTRLSGDVRVEGGWQFRPLRWLDVGPTTVEAHSFSVSRGMGEPYVDAVTGRLEVTVHPFDLRTFQGADMIHRVSVQGDLSGILRVDSIVDRALGPLVAAETPCSTEVEASVVVDHGVVRPGTRAHLGRLAAALSVSNLDVDANLDAELQVDAGATGKLRVAADSVRLAEQGVSRGALASLAVSVASRDLDLERGFSDATYQADVRGAVAPSLGYWLQRLGLRSRESVQAGRTTLDAALQGSIAERSVRGRATFAIDRLALDARPIDVQADASGTIDVSASLRARRADLSGTRVTLARARAKSKGVTLTVPRMTVEIPRAVLAPGGALGRLNVDVPDMVIPDLAPLTDVLHLPRGVTLQGGSVRGRAQATVDLGDGTADGSAHLVARGLGVLVASEALHGDLEVVLEAKQRGWNTDVSGSRIAFTSDARQNHWWARGEVPSGTVSLRGRGRVRATVTLRARDASPVTSLLKDRADLAAKLAAVLVPTSDLRVRGELVAGPSAFEARSVVASTNGVGVDLDLAQLGGDRIGAVYVEAGPLQAGIDLGDRPQGIQLTGAWSWFAKRTAYIRERERAYE